MGDAVTLPQIDVEGAAPAAPAPPRAPLVQRDGMVAVANPDGTVDGVRPEDAEAAFAQGSRPATLTEWQSAKLGTAGEVAAGAIGIGQGLTFGYGLPAVVGAAHAVGADDFAEDVRKGVEIAKNTSPNAMLGGEIAGSLAGMALLPGGGAAGAVKGEGLLARGLSRFASAAPRAALEGAGIGIGQQLSEDALGNHALVGEKYVAAGLEGGLLAAFLGGGLHAGGGALADKARSVLGGAGRSFYGASEAITGATERAAEGVQRTGDDVAAAMRKVAGTDIEALAERQFGFAPKGLGEKVREAYVKGAAGVSGKDASIIDRLTRFDAEGREARRIAVFDGERELESATKEFRSAGDGMLRSNKLTMEEFQGELKAEKIAGAVRRGNEAEVVAYTRGQISKAIETAEAELRHEAGVAPQSIKSLEGIARTAYHADAEIAAAVAKGGNVNETAFMQLDRVKRDVQRWVSGGHNSVFRIADPYEARLAQRSVRTLDSLQEGMRKGLEDSGLFGKAGEVQKAINADWTMQIDASKRFHNALTTEVGRDPTNPFRQMRGIDPSKADTYARGLLNPNADLTHQAVKDYVSSTERLARTLRDNVTLPADKLAEVEATIASAKRFRTAVEKAEGTMTLVNQYKHLTERGGDGFAALAGSLGFASGGPVGGLVGSALGSLASPGRTVSQLASLERMKIKVDEKIGDAVRGFLSGSRAAAAKAGESAAGATTKVTDETVRAIREATRDPAALTARIGEVLGGKGLGEAAPKTSQAMASTLTRAAIYLRDKAPKEPPPSGIAFVPQPPRPMSHSELATYAEIVHAVNDPVSVVDDLRHGRVSREQVAALKTVYPELYQHVRAELAAQAIELRPTLSTQQEIALSVLFDVPVGELMKSGTVLSFMNVFKKDAASQPSDGQSPQGQPRQFDRERGSMSSGFDRMERDA